MKSVPARSVSPLRARTSRRAPGIPCALVLVTVFALGGHIARADSQRDSSAAFAAPRLPSESEIESAASAEQQRIQRAAGPRNQVFLVSTRGIGSSRDVQRVSRGLQVESAVVTNQALGRWTAASLDDVLASDDPRMATVVFVHGNRVSPGTDKQLGEMVYRRLVTAQSASQPFRLIVWSWPASTIRGLIRDYRVKAARTDPAGWQLAWFLQRGNPSTPVGLIGYSYGARVVNGALQLLAGGRMRGMELPKRPTRPTSYRALLIAAAVDADWLLPSRAHGRALQQVDRMTLLVNHLDPAMRWYKLSTQGRKAAALGYRGPPSRNRIIAANRLHYVDVSHRVGRSHFLSKYLADGSTPHNVWRNILFADADIPPTSHTVGYDSFNQTTSRIHQR